MTEILLGTIALEPNRWYGITRERRGTITLSHWLDRVAGAGFDGIELWESHLCDAAEVEARAVLAHPLPIRVFNTYVSFEDDDDRDRERSAAWIRRSGATKVKWNTGPDRDENSISEYGERLSRWSRLLPATQLVCECHDGTATDDPAVAARVLAAGGGVDVSQALVHSNDGHDRLREKFAAYGERITHVHVNHLDAGSPPLTDIRDELASTVTLLRDLGFDGTWTIEFVNGTGSPHEHLEAMLDQAIADLAVLRSLLDL